LLSHPSHVRLPFASSGEGRLAAKRFSRTGQTTSGMRPPPRSALQAIPRRPAQQTARAEFCFDFERAHSVRQTDPGTSLPQPWEQSEWSVWRCDGRSLLLAEVADRPLRGAS
jgi:hypothetical protein